PWLQAHRIEAIDASWVAGEPPAAGPYSAKTRYRQADAACRLQSTGEADTGFALEFASAQWAATPGQSAVLYQGEVCLGGGIIAAASSHNHPRGAADAATEAVPAA